MKGRVIMSPEVAAALWTGGITVFGSALTLIITNSHNKKILHKQLEHQSKVLDAQYKHQSETLKAEQQHQKELSIIQHSLDKRTEVVLGFCKVLEESLGILNYFHTEKADFERREALKPEYRENTNPYTKDAIIQERITVDNMNKMLNYALEQIGPIEEKLINLDITLNLLSIYLSEEEEEFFLKVVSEVRTFSHLIINGLRHRKKLGDPMDIYLLGFVHIADPYVPRLKKLNEQVKQVRLVTKKYVYVDKLEK